MLLQVFLAASASLVAAQQVGDKCYTKYICNTSSQTLLECQNGVYKFRNKCSSGKYCFTTGLAVGGKDDISKNCYLDLLIPHSTTKGLSMCYQDKDCYNGLTCVSGVCTFAQPLASGTATCATTFKYQCDNQAQVLYECVNGVYKKHNSCPSGRYCLSTGLAVGGLDTIQNNCYWDGLIPNSILKGLAGCYQNSDCKQPLVCLANTCSWDPLTSASVACGGFCHQDSNCQGSGSTCVAGVCNCPGVAQLVYGGSYHCIFIQCFQRVFQLFCGGSYHCIFIQCFQCIVKLFCG
ncbi:hypothetical protein HDU98_007683 [Podochytrium sp. JEL0797]|nr:hypothetical protein HDU98_007683 [Podochytrium sp. JEL0797]